MHKKFSFGVNAPVPTAGRSRALQHRRLSDEGRSLFAHANTAGNGATKAGAEAEAEQLPAGTGPLVRIGDGTEGHADHQLSFPLGIASVPVARHLVVVTSGSNQVRVYNTSTMGEGVGSGLVSMMGREDGAKGRGEGEFCHPYGVVVTADSAHVIVGDMRNNRLVVLALTASEDGSTASLAFESYIGEGQLNDPRGLALRSTSNSQTVLVAEAGANEVSEWTMDGTKIRSIGGDGELNWPSDVAVLPMSGEIAVADTFNHRISIFDCESGNFVRTFGSQGLEEDGQFYEPCAVASDGSNRLLVLDSYTDRLQVFAADATHLCTRRDLGIKGDGSNKGLEWRSEDGECGLLIANSSGHDAVMFGEGEWEYEQK